MAAELHIVIQPEVLFHVGGFPVTNTLFTSYLLSTVLILFLLFAKTQIKQTNRPKGLQNILEAICEGLFGLVESIAGKGKQALTFTPLIAGFFVFILLNNWIELIPGFHTIVYTGQPGIHLTQVPSIPKAFAAEEELHPIGDQLQDDIVEEDPEHAAPVAGAEEAHQEEDAHSKGVALFRGAHADLNMTLALSLISIAATQYFGIRYVGLAYFQKFINFSSPINFFVGLLEIISEVSKILSFAFRLFGNIFAGEVLIAVMSYLIPIILPMPFYGLELFVGFIQALVFSMLSLVYFQMASEKHEH